MFSWRCPVSCLSLAETANWAESGKHQFWSWPSDILNLRSSNIQETVDFTPPWYKKLLKNPESANLHTYMLFVANSRTAKLPSHFCLNKEIISLCHLFMYHTGQLIPPVSEKNPFFSVFTVLWMKLHVPIIKDLTFDSYTIWFPIDSILLGLFHF